MLSRETAHIGIHTTISGVHKEPHTTSAGWKGVERDARWSETHKGLVKIVHDHHLCINDRVGYVARVERLLCHSCEDGETNIDLDSAH